MAQKIQTLFIDDLDGSAAEGTVRFGLDGTEYEIDLNEEHAKELREALARLCGRRAAGQRRCSPAGADRAADSGGRAEYHRGPRVGQSPGYRGQGPRPGTCRAGREIQGGHRAVTPGSARAQNIASCRGQGRGQCRAGSMTRDTSRVARTPAAMTSGPKE